ncbi:MAG: TadE/TadG family type IV pilus assembly protein [Sulfitobacter sp.]|nr:TadE/TadG family type IV pilus assembly protein [Sulfitobacter sp.]
MPNLSDPRLFWRDQSGAVAVEFVFLAPLLFALLFGVMILGHYMGLSHSISQLAAGAARASVAGLDAQEREELALAYLSDAPARYPLLDPRSLTSRVDVTADQPPAIQVSIDYRIDGSVLEIANGLLKLGIEDLNGRAYLAY